VRNCIGRKLHLEGGEMLHHQRGKVSIFTQGEQVLLVQSVDVRLRILVDDSARDDDRTTLVRRSDSIDTETSW
jgi:hypothetical protein